MTKKKTGAFDDDEDEESAQVLSGMKGESPFCVPDGYFDQLPGMIMKKCQTRHSEREWTWGFFDQRASLLLAASVIVLITIGFFLVFANPWKRSPVEESRMDQLVSEIERSENVIFFTDEELIIDEIISRDISEVNDTTGAVEEWLAEDRVLGDDELVAICVDEKIDPGSWTDLN